MTSEAENTTEEESEAEEGQTGETEVAEDDGKVKIKVKAENYVSTKSAGGKKSLRRNDAVAEALDGLTSDNVYDVAVELLEEDFRPKYAHLNIGMQRMNVGNRLRAWTKNGKDDEDREAALATVCEPYHVAATAADKAIADKAAAKAAETSEEEGDEA